VQTDHISAWEALLATAISHSTTCTVCTRIVALGSTIAHQACNAMRVINRLLYNQPHWCQLDCKGEQPISTITNVVDDITYYSVSTPSWTQTTMTDSHKFLAVRHLSRRLLDQSKNTIFTYPYLHLSPSLRWSHQNFVQIFCNIKLESLRSVVCMIQCLAILLQLQLVTDGRTCDDSKYRASIALYR